ncbi:Rha family phage regulatory protein [Oxalobacteraceae bacterium GrIS 1.11]
MKLNKAAVQMPATGDVRLNSDRVRSRQAAPASSTALVHFHMGKPVTDSLAISQEFDRRHDNVLQKLDDMIADRTISRLDFKERDYTDMRGKQQRMIELTERGALIAMPFIGGRNSRAGQVRLVDAFLALRDQLAEHIGDWSDSRKKVSTGYAMMSDALQEVRADDGKATSAHHYANEAKLVNWVLFRRFEAVNRDDMEQADLDLMDKVEAKNAIWIAMGRTYAQRKEALPAYLLSLHAQRKRSLQ